MVKHRRHEEYARANLHNTLNAVAGLLVVVLFLNENKAKFGELRPDPQLLRPSQNYGVVVGGGISYF